MHRAPGELPKYLAGFLSVSLLLGAISVFLTHTTGHIAAPASTLSEPPDRPIVVVDPGHGGEDGGALAADGTREKELNLAVAETLAELLTLSGFDVRMTRTDDRLLYDLYGDRSDYSGYKKTYDLRNRLRFAKEADSDLFVSIHMNHFPDQDISGLQVYYAASKGSRETAEKLQKYVRLHLQPENNRLPKQATSSIYLLHRADFPAVMIECGFLSNDTELQNLKDASYRQKLALTVACAITDALYSTSTP